MKRILFFILPCILVTCTSTLPRQLIETATTNPKLFALTAEAETVTSGYPANDATITAIMATKYAGGTEMAATLITMAETMTAMPTETPIPTIPPDSPFCRPADLKTTFDSNGAMESILLGAGLTNISDTPCYLQAWPQVLLVDRQGKPLDVDYHYFDVGSGDAVSAATEQAQESASAKVGLWPGWTVWLNLIWQNWCGTPVSGGVIIRLTLSNNAGVVNIPTDIQGGGCNAPGYRSFVGISKLSPATPPQ